ncbi:MAG: PEPxxWA-CTERM sorting domain-containing protein, partial [Bradyrhizobium sp.]
ITWWSPSMNPAVTATGTGVVTLPLGSDMFAQNSLGTNNDNFFETAILSGTFTLAAAGTVNFLLGSDDDAFVYINGVLVGQNPGIHGISDVDFSTTGNEGVNTIEVFYADREQTQAHLDLSADVAFTASVPEPSTWTMMILGFFGVGFAAYRRKGQAALRGV